MCISASSLRPSSVVLVLVLVLDSSLSFRGRGRRTKDEDESQNAGGGFPSAATPPWGDWASLRHRRGTHEWIRETGGGGDSLVCSLQVIRAAPSTMSTTPLQRRPGTCSCRMNFAARVV